MSDNLDPIFRDDDPYRDEDDEPLPEEHEPWGDEDETPFWIDDCRWDEP